MAIILLPHTMVKAEEYEWVSDELIGENVVTEKRYRFYFENKHGEYVRLGQASSFQYEDENDVIYDNYSDWNTTCPPKDGYAIENGTEYNWQEIKPAHYIIIRNKGNQKIKINKIKTFNLNTQIKYYNSVCMTCSGFTEIGFEGYLRIKLAMSVYVKNISIYLDVSDNATFDILYSVDGSFDDNSIVAKVSGNSEQKEYKYNKDDYTIFNNYTQTFVSYDKKEDEFTKIISTKDVCRYKEIMTFRYNIERLYYDDNYYRNNSELTDLEIEDRKLFVKDPEDYKVYYRYMTDEEIREKERLLNDEKIEIVKTITNKPRYGIIFLIMFFMLIIYKKCRLKKR